MSRLKFAVITVSDRCSRGEANDLSGPALEKAILSHEKLQGSCISHRYCIPDDLLEIKKLLGQLADTADSPDVILTTGGTGFSPRDVTPEATAEVIEREAPALMTAITIRSLEKTDFAMLSRSKCGIRKKSVIINLPGSLKGALECFLVIAPVLPHAVHLMKNDLESVQKLHGGRVMQMKSKVATGKVGLRARESTWPMISVEDAVRLIFDSIPEPEVVFVTTDKALGEVLAEDVFAVEPLPPFRASIKDGYAVIASDGLGVRKVIGSSTAGCDRGQCLRVNTGSVVPTGSDAVVQVEDTKVVLLDSSNEEVEIDITVAPVIGQDIREIGSDIYAGEKVLEKGSKLWSSELGLLASVGVTKVHVHRKPIVSVLSTGNELVPPEENLLPGKVRDSNRTILKSLLKENGFDVIDMGIAQDHPDILFDKVNQSLEKSDVLITTGSVSMGEKDYLKLVLKEDLNCKILFGRVDLKPGKPTTFGTFDDELGRRKLVFALPGNPSSAFVTFHIFVLPALRKMAGDPKPLPTQILVQADSDFVTDTRVEYKRAFLDFSQNPPIAVTTGNQISSRLLSCKEANCLLMLPSSRNNPLVKKGSILTALIIGRI